MIERFNVLRDPWIPVWDGDTRRWVTYRAVLTGEVEQCEEVAYSQDALRVFTHCLLSALTQALFEPKNLNQWETRLHKPMSDDEFEARVREVEADFELLGNPGWMQFGERTEENLTTALVHELSETHRPKLWRIAGARDALSPACATVALYGAQMFATGGGQGYSPSVRGSPPLTTLVRGCNLRETTWANVLVRSASDRTYAEEPSRPWALGPMVPEPKRSEHDQGEAEPEQTEDPSTSRDDAEASRDDEKGSKKKGWAQYKKPAREIGLVEGLFWKPRCVRLAPAEDGVCCLSGEYGPRVRVCGFEAGAKKEDGYFEHPWTPSQRKTETDWRPQHLPDDRPVWSGLADMLSMVRTNQAQAKRRGVGTRCAPVVAQWFQLTRPLKLQLYVFAYRFDNAKLEGRFFQAFPAIRRAGDSAFIERVEQWVALASDVLGLLLEALKKVKGDKPSDAKGNFWLESARWEFWRQTERPFWNAVAALDAGCEPEPIVNELARTAEALFNEHTEPAELEAKRQRRIAVARKELRQELNKLKRNTATPAVAAPTEGVTP